MLLVAAAKEKSTSVACLWLARSGYVRLFLSEDVIEEVADVLNRPKIRAAFETLTDELVNSFLEQSGSGLDFSCPSPAPFSPSDFIASGARILYNFARSGSESCPIYPTIVIVIFSRKGVNPVM